MRKFIILLLCLSAIFTTNVCAQGKGDMYVGGSFNFGASIIPYEEYKLSSFAYTFSPEYSYFVADNFRIGAELSCNFFEGAAIINLSPTFAYYIELIDKFYYTPEIALGGGLMSGKDFTFGGFSLGLNLVAFELRPSDHVGIFLNYDNYSYVFLPENSSSKCHFAILTSIGLGFRYYF